MVLSLPDSTRKSLEKSNLNGVLSDPARNLIISSLNVAISILDSSIDDLELGIQAVLVFVRTNLDDLLDEVQVNVVDVLMDNMESLLPGVSQLIGKVCSII